MRARTSHSESIARHIRAVVDHHSSRSGFPPAALVLTEDETLGLLVSKRLRDRGCDVLELHDTASFHRLLRDGGAFDLLIVDGAMTCSPFHGLGYARRRGLDLPAIAIVRSEDEHTRFEAEQLDLTLCNRAAVRSSLDRLLLGALHWLTQQRTSRAA